MSDANTFDILIAGGGTAGAALAGIIARDTDLRVGLLEAGPDYGPLASGNWPPDLLDARTIPLSHDWEHSGLNYPVQAEPHPYPRARVIGGCSSHNGCVALLGHQRDYDRWAELGNDGWGWQSVASAFERAKQRLRVRIPTGPEITPYQAAFIDAAVAAGIPRVADLNDPQQVEGVAPSPANIVDGARWNTALAYLDPVRDRPNLTIIENAFVDRVHVQDGRATGLRAIVDGQPREFSAGRVVISAGAYGSSAILLRSGIGAREDIARLDVPLTHDLPGVGNGLTDHPVVHITLQGSDKLNRDMARFEATRWMPDEQTLLKARSSVCEDAFDLHLYAVGGRNPDDGSWWYVIEVSCVDVRSMGKLGITGTELDSEMTINHGYLTDDEGHDRIVLRDGLRLARRIARNLLAAGQIDTILAPEEHIQDPAVIDRWLDESVGIYYHPASSCRMGPAGDPDAVVSPHGQVHGLRDLYVCDASIFPVLMRANTNLPALMLAEHMAGWIAG